MRNASYSPMQGMVKTYPELGALQEYYEGQGFGKAEADAMLRYMAVLTDPRIRDTNVTSRERKAAKEVPTTVLGKIKAGKDSGKYAEWVTKWFSLVYNAKMSVWFAMKTALMQQNEYLMQPLDPKGDMDKQADARKKVLKEQMGLLEMVESMEDRLFANPDFKKVVNEELERHKFAGYPELFAMERSN